MLSQNMLVWELLVTSVDVVSMYAITVIVVKLIYYNKDNNMLCVYEHEHAYLQFTEPV